MQHLHIRLRVCEEYAAPTVLSNAFTNLLNHFLSFIELNDFKVRRVSMFKKSLIDLAELNMQN